MTTDSPWTVGNVTTRMSIGLPSTLQPDATILRRRRWEMSSLRMILIADRPG